MYQSLGGNEGAIDIADIGEAQMENEEQNFREDVSCNIQENLEDVICA
jgi:hypothetical protein